MSEELLEKINDAVKAANAAEKAAETAQAELISKSKAVGLLLIEAKKLHPAVADFKTFLKKVRGLSLSRAYDFMKLAGGRTTDEELKKDARKRQAKRRAKKKSSPLPQPEPQPAAGFRDVTESAEASAERRKVENANLAPSPEEPPPTSPSPEESAAKLSAHNLSEFQVACRTYLPHLTEADLKKARVFFMEGAWKPEAKRQEAA